MSRKINMSDVWFNDHVTLEGYEVEETAEK